MIINCINPITLCKSEKGISLLHALKGTSLCALTWRNSRGSRILGRKKKSHSKILVFPLIIKYTAFLIVTTIYLWFCHLLKSRVFSHCPVLQKSRTIAYLLTSWNYTSCQSCGEYCLRGRLISEAGVSLHPNLKYFHNCISVSLLSLLISCIWFYILKHYWQNGPQRPQSAHTCI